MLTLFLVFIITKGALTLYEGNTIEGGAAAQGILLYTTIILLTIGFWIFFETTRRQCFFRSDRWPVGTSSFLFIIYRRIFLKKRLLEDILVNTLKSSFYLFHIDIYICIYADR